MTDALSAIREYEATVSRARRSRAASRSPSRVQPAALVWPPPPYSAATRCTSRAPLERRLTRS